MDSATRKSARPDGAGAGAAAAAVASFFPGANKKKLRGQIKERSFREKRERMWGKTPQKPYISSSLGDMARVMMRYACMESTYFYNTVPPPVAFYDYWQKFSVDPNSMPSDFVDRKKASIANLKKNTSSFNFFGQHTSPIESRHNLGDAATLSSRPHKNKIRTADNQNIADIWKDVRISMSSESFISSSTKISESASQVELEDGWEEPCSEDYQSSESDYGLDTQDRTRHHRHRQPGQWGQLGADSLAQKAEENKQSSLEFHTPQGLLDKQDKAIAQSIQALQKKDQRILYELAMHPRDLDIIDYFADDLDDSFLLDNFSYSELPDTEFGPDFDYFNENNQLHRKNKGRKMDGGRGHHHRGSRKGSRSGTTMELETLLLDPRQSLATAGGGGAGGGGQQSCIEIGDNKDKCPEGEENCKDKKKSKGPKRKYWVY